MQEHNGNQNFGIDYWERSIPALWHETCALLAICRNSEKRTNQLPTLDSENCELVRFFEHRNDFTKTSAADADGGSRDAGSTNLSSDAERERTSRRKGSAYLRSTLLISSTHEIPNPYMPTSVARDQHLREGLFISHRTRRGSYPRLARLVLEAYIGARYSRHEREGEDNPEYLPSPLAIIARFLTVPEQPETALYANAACRNWLSRIFQIGFKWPEEDEKRSQVPPSLANWEWLDAEQLSAGLNSFRNHDAIQVHWPVRASSDVARRWQFVGHLVAVIGRARLRFPRNKGKTWSQQLDRFLKTGGEHRPHGTASEHRDWVLELLLQPDFRGEAGFEFLPSLDEMVNRILGLPVPIRGMDFALGAGLRTSANGGLVISLSGGPGTGKTSFALALANALAPFRIPTLYVALEEAKTDLESKFRTVSRQSISDISIHMDSASMLEVIASTISNPEFGILSDNILQLQKQFLENAGGTSVLGTKWPVKGMVVIDNINMIAGQALQKEQETKVIREIEKFVLACRKNRMITVLIGAADLMRRLRIDYRTDVGFQTDWRRLRDLSSRPFRTLTIVKLRHQGGRQGSQLMHIGSGKGLRLVPQLDAMMAAREAHTRRLIDKSHQINVFREVLDEINSQPKHPHPIPRIFPGGSILLHGYGSSGKAGLGLRLLLTKPERNPQPKQPKQPKHSKKRKQPKFSPTATGERRVLVLSFLYPASYYEGLLEKPAFSSTQLGYFHRRERNYKFLAFYPGHFSPQDFLYKVVNALDQAILEGTPYTGVMIDGLHNVFLQYPKLQESNTVWSTLYNILARYDVTVVSTFTQFAVNDHSSRDPAQTPPLAGLFDPDQQLMQKGMTPFLNALVKASDFFFSVREEFKPNNERLYVFSTKAAVGQAIPPHHLLWDRDKCHFTAVRTHRQLQDELGISREQSDKAATAIPEPRPSFSESVRRKSGKRSST